MLVLLRHGADPMPALGQNCASARGSDIGTDSVFLWMMLPAGAACGRRGPGWHAEVVEVAEEG